MNTREFQPQDKSLNAGATLQTQGALTPLEAPRYTGSSSLFFIDAGVSQIDTLIAGMAPGTEVHILKSGSDAITQVTETLLNRQGISSLNIISHGSAGSLDFAPSSLNAYNIRSYTEQLKSWGSVLTENADILLYGCNVALGNVGQLFVEQIAQLTSSDVAASDDLTGNAALGGDWELEVTKGLVEALPLFKFASLQGYNGILNTAPTTQSDTYTVFTGNTFRTELGNVTSLVMTSEQGDYVGQGKSYNFTPSSGTFSGVRTYPSNPSSNNGVRIDYQQPGTSSIRWDLSFAAPFNEPLTAGRVYDGATRFPFQATNVPGIDINGEGRGFNRQTGKFTVNQILYGSGDVISSFDATFEQRGENATGVLRGQIKYNATANNLPAGVLTNDADTEKNVLTASLVNGPSNGTLNFNSNGTFTYTARTGFVGTDTFTYIANDGLLNSTPTTVTLNVVDPNSPPAISLTAPDASAVETTPASNPGTYRISRFIANSPLTVKLTIDSSSTASTSDYNLNVNIGTVSVSGSTITVVMPTGITDVNLNLALVDDVWTEGAETLKLNLLADSAYAVNTSKNTATVTIESSDPNIIPVATNDTYTILEDTTLVTGLANITSWVMNSESGNYVGQGKSYNFNPSTGNFTATRAYSGDNAVRLSYNSTTSTTSSWWDAEFAAPLKAPLVAGTTYTNVGDFPFQLNTQPGMDISGDGRGNSDLTGQFTVNQILYGSGDNISSLDVTFEQLGRGDTGWLRGRVQYNATQNNIPAGVLTNDVDGNKQPLTAVLVNGPANGQLVFNSDGTFRYTPNANFFGTDSFTYRAFDGLEYSSIATVALNITAVNDAPTISNVSKSGNEGNVIYFTDNDFSNKFTDVDGNNLTKIRITSLPLRGKLKLGNTDITLNQEITTANIANLTFTPEANFEGTVSFGWNGFDGTTYAATGNVVSITINPIPKWQIETTADFLGAGKQQILQRTQTGAYRLWYLNANNIAETIALPTMGANWKITSISNFDTNNTKDIFWQDSATGENQIWRMGANGASVLTLPTINPNNVTVQHVGDFEGDGDADILVRNSSNGEIKIWETNPNSIREVVLPSVADNNTQIKQVSDLDGDGDLDILWYNSVTGSVAVWGMNGTNFAQGVGLPTVSDTNTKIQLVADFDGDNDMDIMWYNGTTGLTALWEMNGINLKQGVVLGYVSDTNTKIKHIGKFDNDNDLDILWYNDKTGYTAIWELDGVNFKKGIALADRGDTNTKIERIADFDGDGDLDIFWYNAVTGFTGMWQMNGVNRQQGISLGYVSDTNTKIKSIANFDGDTDLDIFWHNETTGFTAMWNMNGANLQQGLALPTIQTGFKVNVVGDLNGDGKLDIVWYNSTTNATKVWLTNGASVLNDILLPS